MIITHKTHIPSGVTVRILKGAITLGCVVEANLKTRSCRQDLQGLTPNQTFVEADTWDTLVIKNTTGQPLPSPWKEAVEKYTYVLEVSP